MEVQLLNGNFFPCEKVITAARALGNNWREIEQVARKYFVAFFSMLTANRWLMYIYCWLFFQLELIWADAESCDSVKITSIARRFLNSKSLTSVVGIMQKKMMFPLATTMMMTTKKNTTTRKKSFSCFDAHRKLFWLSSFSWQGHKHTFAVVVGSNN